MRRRHPTQMGQTRTCYAYRLLTNLCRPPPRALLKLSRQPTQELPRLVLQISIFLHQPPQSVLALVDIDREIEQSPISRLEQPKQDEAGVKFPDGRLLHR